MWRISTLAALAVGLWLLSAYGSSRPAVLGANAPASQFSAARAGAVLSRLLPDQQPHPAGSPQAEQVRARILKELAAMGIQAHIQSGMSCHVSPRDNFLPCGTVSNILADALPGSGKVILLMAHGDSVAAGPGAGDDGSGVAILLETIRALKARPAGGGHPVVALFTDGEEADLLGSSLYLRDPKARDTIAAVINVEARGNQGPSYLFQTSSGNARLIDLYAASVSHYTTSSFYQEVYQRLPNDTDLTPMLGLGVPAFNFAFIGNFAQYHTPLDRRENLDLRSVQQQGEAALGLADRLRHTDLSKLKGGNAIYLDVLGHWLPRMPASWALPLSIACFVLIALAGLWTQGRAKGHAWAAVTPPLLIALCVGMGFVLHGVASFVSGHADPSFAYPLWLRLALALGCLAPALLLARRSGAIACWLWFAALAIASATFAPGLAPYFLFPSLIAAPLLLATIRGGRGFALAIAALAALIIWIGFNQGSESIMGLRLHPLFTFSAGFALLAVLPWLKAQSGARFGLASGVLAIALAVVAGLQPAYSGKAPERLNLRYVEMDGKAFWLADPVSPLPLPVRAAADFSASPQPFAGLGRFYVAPAGPAHFPPPQAAIHRQGDELTLDVNAPGDGVVLLMPKTAQPRGLAIKDFSTPTGFPLAGFSCATPDCGHARLLLRPGPGTKGDFLLIGYRQGLPAEGSKLLKARPDWAVPSQAGDRTFAVAKIAIPRP